MKKIMLAAIIGATFSSAVIANEQLDSINQITFDGSKSGFFIDIEQRLMQYDANFTAVEGDNANQGSIDQSMTLVGAGYQWHAVQTSHDVLLKATLVYGIDTTGQYQVVPKVDLDSFGAKFKVSTSLNPERNVFAGIETSLLSTRGDEMINQKQYFEMENVQLGSAATLDFHINDSLTIGGLLGMVANSADIAHSGLVTKKIDGQSEEVYFKNDGKLKPGFVAGVNASYTF